MNNVSIRARYFMRTTSMRHAMHACHESTVLHVAACGCMSAWTCMGACACGSVRISDWIVSVTRFCVVDSRRREPQLPWASKSCEFGLKNTKRGLAKKASRQSPFFFLRPKTTYPVLCLKKKNGPVKNGSYTRKHFDLK